MKKLATTIVGLSLFVGSALSAQDGFGAQSFYPAENVDTPSYLIDNDIGQATQSLAKSSIKSGTLTAFFPAVNEDTPEFLRDSKPGQSVVAQLATSSLKHCNLTALYPAENNDSPVAHISC